jgi:DNA-binding transcriptional MocR family regulator
MRPKTNGSPVYLELADRLERQIRARVFQPGDRLPSVRQLCDSFRLSVETVLHGLRVLEDRGLVEARPRSGHYAKCPISVPEPNHRPLRMEATAVQLSRLRHEMYLAGTTPGVIPLSIATPSPELLPARALGQIISQIVRSSRTEIVRYTSPEGHPQLRRQLARRSRTWGCALTPDDVLVTNGASEALSIALRVTCPAGSTVLVESPTYYGILELISTLGLQVVELPAHAGCGIQLDQVERVLQANPGIRAAVFITNHNNPLGYALTPDVKRGLADLLARHGVAFIEDDIYGDLAAPLDPRPVVAKAFDLGGNVLLCGSISKVLAPGLRVGWLVPGRFYENAAQLKSTALPSPTLNQMAVAEFLAHGAYDAHLRRLRRLLANQITRFRYAVAESFPPGTRLSRPAGGFVLWVELPGPVDTVELARTALHRHGITVAPGCIFSATGRAFRNHLRLSCGCSWSPKVEQAIRTLGKMARAD